MPKYTHYSALRAQEVPGLLDVLTALQDKLVADHPGLSSSRCSPDYLHSTCNLITAYKNSDIETHFAKMSIELKSKAFFLGPVTGSLSTIRVSILLPNELRSISDQVVKEMKGKSGIALETQPDEAHITLFKRDKSTSSTITVPEWKKILLTLNKIPVDSKTVYHASAIHLIRMGATSPIQSEAECQLV